MSVPSIEFLLPLIAVAAVFFLLPSAAWRRILFALCNAAFFAVTIPDNPSRLTLLLFVLSGYVAAKILQIRPSRALFTGYLLLLIASFAILKKYSLITILLPAWMADHTLVTIGLSYALFRQIHVLVDIFQQQVLNLSFWSYFNYQFNLFGFVSGPIQRYQEFEPRWREMSPIIDTRHELLRAYLRLFIGVIKAISISGYFLAEYELKRTALLHSLDLGRLSRMQVLARFGVVLYGYPLYLYFNFSGYSDVVIAGAALLGIKMPENFDRPYLSRNVSDFWTRFHRSLGFWIRDYLFTPMYKAAATRWSSAAQWLAFPCYFIAFVLAGIWHGNTLNFLVFGLLHGLGICIGKLWELWITKRRGRKGLKTYLASALTRVIAIIITVNFVSFTMLFFPNSVSSATQILQNVTHKMIH